MLLQTADQVDNLRGSMPPRWWLLLKGQRFRFLRWRLYRWRLLAVLLTACVFVCFFVHFLAASYLWCAMDPKVQYDTCELSKQISSLLSKHGVKHWMQLGDSVGLIRHGNQLPWEHDVDICVASEDFEKASATLRNPTLRYRWYQRREDGGLWIFVYPQMGPYIFGRFGGQPIIVDVWNCADEFPKTGEPIEVDWYPYCNDHMFPFPKDLFRFVESYYGPGWKVPRYEHHILQCSIWNDSPVHRMKMFQVNSTEDFYRLQAQRASRRRAPPANAVDASPNKRAGSAVDSAEGSSVPSALFLHREVEVFEQNPEKEERTLSKG